MLEREIYDKMLSSADRQTDMRCTERLVGKGKIRLTPALECKSYEPRVDTQAHLV